MVSTTWRGADDASPAVGAFLSLPRTSRRAFITQAGVAALGALLLPGAAPASAAIGVPFLSQRAQPWAPDILGFNTDRKYTIRDYGCVITSLAMIFNYYQGGFTNPRALNEALKSKQGYTAGSGLVKWDVTGQVAPSGVTYEKSTTSFSVMEEDLRAGRPVLGFMTHSNGTHAIVVVDQSSSGYTFLDPADTSQVLRSWPRGGRANGSFAQLSLSAFHRYKKGAASSPSPTPSCGVGQYVAQYYNNRTLSGNPVFQRCESTINYDWGGGGPGNGVPSDNFSVRWTGRHNFDGATYTFIARADDGIRVWFDGSLIVDAWKDQGPTEYRVSRNVSAGQHEVKVEYYENGGGAVAQVRWEKGSAPTPNPGPAPKPNPPTRSEVTVDDRAGGFSKGGQYWWEASIGLNSHMFWTYVNGNAVSSWGEWRANLAGGNYEVYVFVPRDHATTRNARYEIYHNGGTATRAVNQNSYFDAWVSVGTYNFSSGDARRVRLTDATGESGNTRLKVGFDAVKLVPR